MFVHMKPVKNANHSAHGNEYELLVYQVDETGEYRIFVNKGGFGLGPIYTASQEVVNDAALSGMDIVDALIKTAEDDINRNEFNDY